MAFMPVECADCGAHFQMDPAGSVQGTACDHCGGTRFFMDQPSPTKSDGTLRDMVDSDTQIDQGGNPLGEGTIMGNDGEQPLGKRDNFMHSRVAANIDDEIWTRGYEGEVLGPYLVVDMSTDINGRPEYVTRMDANGKDASMSEGEYGVDWEYVYIPEADVVPPPGGSSGKFTSGAQANYVNHYASEPASCPQCGFSDNQAVQGTHVCPNCGSWYMHHEGLRPGEPPAYQHPDPWMDNEPGSLTLPQNWAHSATERVEAMRPPTLNMEPYPWLWSDEHVAGTQKTAGPLAALPLVGEGLGAIGLGGAADAVGTGLADAAGSIGLGDLVGSGAKKLLGAGASHLMGGALKAGENAIGMGGQQAGGMSPEQVAPAPGIMQFGSVQDIPAFLAALETSDSVKSVDEHHDNPEDQDQKEFNDGDKSPSNLENPNNEDSGQNGEDATRSDSPEMTGFADDSPGIERAMMVLPLLLHYFNSDESGQSDPVVKGIHDALEAENPGYLNQKHPDGEKAVQMLIEQHAPKQHAAGVNSMPGGLPSVPTPGGELPANNPMQTAGGQCPLCGGVLAADGSCPQCGFKQHPQGGPSQVPAPGMGGTSGPGFAQPFVGKVANNVGPNTPEQKAAVIELLQQQGREGEIPYVETEPWRFADEMAQLQGNPNTAPLVDPSQQQTPPPAMMGAPGAMPVQDPSQPAGGMAQPMQPMARTADANNAIPRCPNCNSATTTVEGEGDNTGDGSTAFAHCHACGKNFDIPVRESRVILTEMVNPALEDASQLHDVRNESIQDPSRTWTDSGGNELTVGQTYDLYTQGIPTPDVVKVVKASPDQLDLKLVGEFSNVQPDAVDDQRPDFHVTSQQMLEGRYTFEPADSNQQGSTQADGAQGGMPGMEQIPQSPPTTDQISSQYPNGGASISAAVVAGEDEDMDDPDVCHKCGNDRIYHMASSPTRTMHECDRCGSAWETESSDYGERTAASDLSWIYNEGPSNDDFFSEMEHAQKAYGGNSRNISSIAGSDRRLQEIHERLEANKMTRSAGRHFTPMEQKGLVNESGRARNADKLDLSGTHYEAASVSQAMGYDPRDPKNRANGMNAPDEHIVFGL